MKKLFFHIFIFVFSSRVKSFSQNLVSNNSFENTTCCPTNGTELYNIPSCVLPWFNPAQGSPDYFNACASSAGVSVPNNWCGYQPTKNGNAYAGFFLYGGGNVSCGEYVEAKMNDSLIAGKKYFASFYVSLCPTSNYALDAVGAYFSKDSLLSTSACHFSVIPQVQNPTGNVIKDTTNWVQVSGSFIAQGGERFITIGNFKDFNNTVFDTVPWGPDGRSYYLLDDVSVIDSANSGVNEIDFSNSISFSPNPATNNITLQSSGFKVQSFELINIMGQIIIQQPLNKQQGKLNIDVSDFPSGVYFLKISSEGKSAVKKFVKI